MGHPALRVAPWAFVALLVLGALAALPGAWASSTPTYTLTGGVEQPSTFAPVPKGVTVDLVSQATHTVYTTQTLSQNGQPSGEFVFTSANTGGTLQPGWWGIQVPPQSKLNLPGCSPCAVLPANQSLSFSYFNATALTTTLYPVTIPNVEVLAYSGHLFGNATNGVGPAVNASVQLLDPSYAGFVIANATTNQTGSFNFSAPWGTWVLKTTLPTSPNAFDYEQVVVAGARQTVNPSISSILVSGHVDQAASGAHVPNGGNATVIDTANLSLYTYPVPPLGFYSVGGYPAGFTGPGSESFDVVLSVVGFGTMWFPMTVSPSGASVPSPHDVFAPSTAPPAVYNTTLDFTKGFGNVTVTTAATLANNSVFSDLPNASVGQLWAQLALDFNHSLGISASDLPNVFAWIQSEGPFFPASQAGTSVNGIPFGTNSSFSFTSSSTCVGVCGLGSSASMSLGWSSHYNTTSSVSATLKNYTLDFSFRHPTHAQSINYTVELPQGYVLSAGQASNPPPGASLVPAGPGGTWTNFTLVSKPYSSASSTASFSIVKYGNVTAIVNVTAANFAFSQKNVLNQTRGNYTVIVGAGENVTFSAANSSFPAGTNGTLYSWSFGDSSPSKSVSQPTTYHTYTGSGAFTGSLTVTSSGGYQSTTAFTVIATAAAPSPAISVNSTVQSANGFNYTIVNWSTPLHFNASLSTATLPSGAPFSPKGVLSVASWNISSHNAYWVANYTAGSGVSNPAGQNDSFTFNGAGYYLTGTTINGQAVSFLGWQYNVTLKLWDGAGHLATTQMVVLVRDTQKPQPAVTALDSRGRSISTAGVVEGSNSTAEVQLSAQNSTDPNNGSLTWYNWTVTDAANTSFGLWNNQSALSGYKMPAKPAYWLAPQSKPYTVNLTVTDRAGNTAYRTATVSIQINVSTRPVLSVTNLTAPSTMNDGSSYTVWVNVTNTLGKNSTAQGVTVSFYLLPTSGSGSRIAIGGSPGSVQFYNYTSNTTTSSTPFATGTAILKYNVTVRAVISYNPDRQGTWSLWANATAQNEFSSSYGANTASVTVTLNANPTTLYEVYAAIAAAVVLVIVGAVFYYRRRMRRGRTTGGKSSSSSKTGLERSKSDEDDDEK